MTRAYHVPIMADRITAFLQAERGGVFVDGTLGGGGHTERILAVLPEGSRLIAIDRDGDAIANADTLKQKYGDKLTLVRDNYENITKVLCGLGISGVDGILLDIGVSSHQIDTAGRGFSYMAEGRLDMRMDDRQGFSAYDVVNGYGEDELSRIFFLYGEEKFARRIARGIVAARNTAPIETTQQLVSVIRGAVPPFSKGGHPAKRVFQAVRIVVNGEITGLERAVSDALNALRSGGRIAVLTFHSLEDRVVKNILRQEATDCICDKSLPICVCGHKAAIKLVDKGAVADESEIKLNPRAESAKLRTAQKL